MRLLFILLICPFLIQAQSPIQPRLIYDFGNDLGKGKNGFDFIRNFDGIIGNGGWMEKNVGLRTFQQAGPDDRTPYGGQAGYCILVDLSGDRNIFDLTKTASITSFQGWDNSFYPDDTLFFYNYDPVMANPDPAARLYRFLRPDSLMTPIASIRVQNGAGFGPAWRTATIALNARYIMFRVKGTDRGYGISFANFGELRINGTPQSGGFTPIIWNTPNPVVKKSYGEVIGINNATALDTTGGWYDAEGNLRTYFGFEWYYTTDEPYSTSLKFNGDYFGDGNITDRRMRYLRRVRNAYTYGSFRGPSRYVLNRKGGLAEASKGAFWDAVGDDPIDPYKQKAAARFGKAFAGKFGTNTSFPVADYWFNNTAIPGAGLDIYKGLEPLNEAENDLAGNVSPGLYFSIITAMYDGWEGRIEANTGVRAADTTFDLIGMGTVEVDFNWYFTFWFFTQTCRTDKKFMLSHINIHHYSTDLYADTYIVGTVESRAGVRGRTPERDSVYQKMKGFADSMRSLVYSSGAGTVEIMCSENGRDQTPNPPPPGGSSVWTPFSIPPMTGLTTDQAKATLVYRDQIIWFMAGWDIYSHYWLNGNVLLSSENVVTFATSHILTGWPQPGEVALTYWSRKHVDYYLRDYQPDSVVNIGKDAICAVRMRHKSNPDSLAWVTWFGTDSTATAAYNIPIPIGASVKRIQHVYGQMLGTVSTIVASPTGVSATTSRQPEIYKYLASSIPAATGTIKFLLRKNE